MERNLRLMSLEGCNRFEYEDVTKFMKSGFRMAGYLNTEIDAQQVLPLLASQACHFKQFSQAIPFAKLRQSFDRIIP